jgi:hypothetical protein
MSKLKFCSFDCLLVSSIKPIVKIITELLEPMIDVLDNLSFDPHIVTAIGEEYGHDLIPISTEPYKPL